MRNLIECNNVIPHILVYQNADQIESVIQTFIRKYNIQNSHVLRVEPLETELTVDQIRQMQKDVSVSFTQMVLVVLRDVDNSGAEVQNGLLKLIEEESERLLFIFFVRHPSHLLPTILSRCSIDANTIFKTAPPLQQNGITTISDDYFCFQSNSDMTKESATEKIDAYLHSGKIKNLAVLQHVLQMRKYIIDNNVNPALGLDSILLFLLKAGTMKVRHGK